MKLFNSARLKLTAWYLLIIMLVSFSFSVTIYHFSTRELRRFDHLRRTRIEVRLRDNRLFRPEEFRRPPFIDPSLLEETRRRLLVTLVLINGAIFVVSGGVGYFLAGRTLQPIREMVDDQNRFISDASHELRTPLTALKTSLEVSLRKRKPTLEELKTVLAEGIMDIDRLQALTCSLLKLSRHFQTLHLENFSLRHLSLEAITKVKTLAKAKEIKIENRVKEITIKGDYAKLAELLIILLDNAIKYSPKGKKIIITGAKAGGQTKIEVIDQGIGIEAKDLPHLFERFYRADSARLKDSEGGYGLGLSIAQRIVEGHRGIIKVKSQPGQGSQFTVLLP